MGRARLGAGWPGLSPLCFLMENQACGPVRGFACSCQGPRPGRELLQMPPGSRTDGSARSDTGLGLGSGEPRGALVSQCSRAPGSASSSPPDPSTLRTRPLSHCPLAVFNTTPSLGPISLQTGRWEVGQVCRLQTGPLRPWGQFNWLLGSVWKRSLTQGVFTELRASSGL